MKITSLLIMMALSVSSLAQTTISGTFSNATEGGKMYLSKLVQNKAQIIDSSNVTKGVVNFKVKPDKVGFYHVGTSPKNFVILVLGKQKETISLGGDATKLNHSYTVNGSKDNELINNFLMSAKDFMIKRDSINKLFRTEGANQSALKMQMNSLSAEFIKYRDNFIVENRTSPAALMTLQYINPKKDAKQFKMVAEGAQISMPGSFYAQNLQAELDKMILPGNMAPDIAYPDTAGTVRKLSDLRGKVVLIDFWASWCRPCRMENPNVVRLYNAYKDKGFEVFSVSLDKDKNRWKAAIIADGLAWPNHVSDLKQWQSEPAKQYGVSGIPFTVLIDAEGRVIETNLRGPALEQKLKEIFGS